MAHKCHNWNPRFRDCEECYFPRGKECFKKQIKATEKPRPVGSAGFTGSTVNGLKDHQIQALTNKITNALRPLISHQCLRELVVRPMTAYLEDNGLRIDKP